MRKKYVLIILAAVLVAADFAVWSQVPVTHTRWCKLSDFSYDSSKESTVSIVRSDDTTLPEPASRMASLTYAQIAAMVDRAIDLAGGLAGRIPSGARTIVIKPNIVDPALNGSGVNTDTRVVKALVLHLYHLNPDYEIKVAEAAGGWARPGTPLAPAWSMSTDGYAYCGYKGMIDSLQADPAYPDLKLEWVDMNYDSTVAVAVPEPRFSDDQQVIYLPRTLVEADFIINTPVMKVHSTSITVGLKNWVGILPGMVYGWSHDQGYNKNGIGLNHAAGHLQKNIVELHRVMPEQFVLVDATMGKEVSKFDSGISKRMNMIVAGEDVVSVDAVCAELMEVNPEDVEHVTLAALAGLGQNDLSRIEVKGGTVEQSRAPFIKAAKVQSTELKNSSYPYWGQSNRTWLLKGAFSQLNMDHDYLGGEAETAPVPGQDGWSEPVYFFDDVIDPAAFYGGTTDGINYAFSYFTASADSRAQLWVGSNQEMTVWLNGAVVYQYQSGFRQIKLPNESVLIDVKEGLNRLLVKVGQRSGVSTFGLNICENVTDKNYAGNRLEGLKFISSVEPEYARGDLNRDSRVNIMDLISLLGAMRSAEPDLQYDSNSDGKVNVFDLLDLLHVLSENN